MSSILASAQCFVPLTYGSEFTITADQIELNTNPASCTVSGTTIKVVGIDTCYIFFKTGSEHKIVRIDPSAAALTIRHDDCNRVYRASNPTFTYTATGFVNGETKNVLSTLPQISTAADTNSDVGAYDIVAQNAVAPHYTIQYEKGILNITPKSQSLLLNTIADQILSSNITVPVSGNASSGLTITLTTQTPNVCTVSGQNVTLLTVGQCSIIATQAGSLNYQAATPDTLSFQVQAPTLLQQSLRYSQANAIQGFVQIHNAKGSVVYEGNIHSAMEFQALGLKPGTYWVRQDAQHISLIQIGAAQ